MIRKLKNYAHKVNAFIAALWYGFPGKKITVVGITGTDGKTTTTHLVHHILKRSGKKASMISTVYAYVAGREYDTGFHTTTPGPWFLQKKIHEAVINGDQYFVIEATAHGIDQNRVWGVPFKIGILTNVTHEHLHSIKGFDYFETMDAYRRVKANLLLSSDLSVINRDDSSYENIRRILDSKNKGYITYGKSNNADINLTAIGKIASSVSKFNQYNYIAAYICTKELGISERKIKTAMFSFKLPPGRLEVVYKSDFTVIVDFAHTINSIRELLSHIKREMKRKGRIIHVFGATGLRDVTKREKMGATSSEYADIIILTEDDTRGEDINNIIEAIAKGVSKGHKLYKIPDRQKAIDKAIMLANKDDWVVLSGKGHERTILRERIDYPWSEEKAVKKALQKKHAQS